MDFIHFLSSHMLDPKQGGKRLYKEVLEQALHAEACGFQGVGIPEHHLVNVLLIPSPLQMAVKIAAHTKRVSLVTSVCQLPLRDMRVFAGEVVQAQVLCEGRLMLGVGRTEPNRHRQSARGRRRKRLAHPPGPRGLHGQAHAPRARR